MNLIEGFNAQLQRMCQVYKEAGIVSDFEDILYLVVNAINNQARKDRMGFTVELLQMNQPMRQQVNENYKFRNQMPAERGPLEVGQYVRVLEGARNQGWSKDVFQITTPVSTSTGPRQAPWWRAHASATSYWNSKYRPSKRVLETGPQKQT